MNVLYIRMYVCIASFDFPGLFVRFMRPIFLAKSMGGGGTMVHGGGVPYVHAVD